MRTARCHIALAIVALTLVLSTPASAQGETPAQACKHFWTAVARQDFKTSWTLLSAYSKQRCVASVVKDSRLKETEVRELFDRNDPAIVKGFWESFRNSSNAKDISLRKFTNSPPSGNRCKVNVTSHKTGNVRPLFSVREGGQWRFGLYESLPKK